MKKLLIFVASLTATVSTCFAQITTPTPGLQYQILNSCGLALSQSAGNNALITASNAADLNQTWTFEAGTDDGWYYLKNVGTSNYMFQTDANYWDYTFGETLPATISKGEFQLEAIDDTYVGIKLKDNSKYFGTDAITDGSWVYADKAISNNGSWQLVLLVSDEKNAYDLMFSQVETYGNTNFIDYDGILGEVNDSLMAIDTDYNNIDAEHYTAGTTVLQNYLSYLKKVKAGIDAMKAKMTEIETLTGSTNYPGLDDLSAKYDEYDGWIADGELNIERALAAEADLNAAIRAYVISQESTASDSNPADYTLLISSPWFCKEANTPKSNSLEDIAAAGLSADVEDRTGWVVGSTATGGGFDQRLNYTQNRTCWNAWHSGATGMLDIHQDIAGLPNGYYSVTCDAITQSACLNDQHAYATSTAETATSPAMTIEGWNDVVTDGQWEALATSKVLVSDGKLTIGMTGTTDLSKASSNGWFCVTNFKLQYYGTADLAALQAAYAAKMAECQAQCDTMRFKGDKATYQDVITANTGKVTEEDISAALSALDAAQDSAEVSIFKQDEVLNGSYKAIQDSIAAGVYTNATLNAIMQSAVDNATAIIDAEGQTKACRDDVINSLRDYRYGYADEYNKALAALSTYVNQSSIDCVQSTLDSQEAAMKGSLMPVADVDAYVAQIEKALKDAAANEIIEQGGADFTAMIVNPACDGTDRKVAANGWTIGMINSGNDQMENYGQQYDGNEAAYYLDAWNGTTGVLLFNAHQTIENLPNGTYTLKAMCRTSGEPGTEGTYLYTIADNDSISGVKLAMVKREQFNITNCTQGAVTSTAGGDSIAYVSDTYGSIWKAAADATSFGNTGSEADLAIFAANSNAGRGWRYVEVEAVVTDHTLTIGFTNDSTFTGGRTDTDGNACIPFTGTWISADNFTLTQTAEGDNTDWSPVTVIEGVENGETAKIEVVDGKIICGAPCKVYTINGQQVNANVALPRGFYIVKTATQVAKVMIK